jgi:hypothetical protein
VPSQSKIVRKSRRRGPRGLPLTPGRRRAPRPAGVWGARAPGRTDRDTPHTPEAERGGARPALRAEARPRAPELTQGGGRGRPESAPRLGRAWSVCGVSDTHRDEREAGELARAHAGGSPGFPRRAQGHRERTRPRVSLSGACACAPRAHTARPAAFAPNATQHTEPSTARASPSARHTRPHSAQ